MKSMTKMTKMTKLTKLTKNELKKQLSRLGIKVVGNYVRKSDVKKIIAEEEEEKSSDKTYKIVRFYQKSHPKEVIKTGLSFEEAQEHCNDDETSSSTCEKSQNVARTEEMGEWFDGYDEE